MASNVLGGRYRLEQQLSSTQMADVWLAHDPVLDRRIVVKILAPAADRLRFEREARAVAALTHPNIVQLYDYGEEAGRPYMVLEHMPGGTLADRLPESKHLPDPETRLIATDVAGGLAYAHQHGVVHRDLKPGNVLFDAEDRAKIADFGIARVQGIDTLTEEGTVLGTAAYMSPEQVVGEPATAASDVYAFAILLYRMLTGRLPFDSPNTLELATMQRDAEAAPVGSLRPDAPADLAALTTAALAKQPSARPRDGSALLAGLEAPEPPTVVADASDAPTRLIPVPPPPAPPGPPPARRLWPVLVVAGVLLAAAGVAAALLVFGSPSSSPADTTTTGRHQPTTTHTATSAPATTATTTPTTPTTSPTATTQPTTATTRPTTTSPPPPTTRPTSPTTATTTPTTSPATTTEPPTTSPGTTTAANAGTTTGP